MGSGLFFCLHERESVCVRVHNVFITMWEQEIPQHDEHAHTPQHLHRNSSSQSKSFILELRPDFFKTYRSF